MKELEQVACPKCGFKNIRITKKCTKCNFDLDENHKTCPRCGKIKSNNVKKCDCGFNFTVKKKSLLFPFLISLGVVILLICISVVNQSLLQKMNFVLKFILLIFVVIMIIRKLVGFRSNELVINPQLEMLEKQKQLKKMKIVSNLAIIIGVIAAFLL